ncbi:MAG TPA: hypothetical protein VM346_01000 [Sphingomicrobium sp.]|nr:hypothetical protein [Sphingomicrobium sp.]
MRIIIASLAAAGGLALGGCAYNGLYGGASLGYGSAGYYDRYFDPYHDPWYRGASYWGWYDGFYYPGTGYYVYDRWRRPHVWNDLQRRYWSQRREHIRSRTGERFEPRENWSGFTRERSRGANAAPPRRQRSVEEAQPRRERAATVRAGQPERAQRARSADRPSEPRAPRRERGRSSEQPNAQEP